MKLWKKELGHANSKVIKLEKENKETKDHSANKKCPAISSLKQVPSSFSTDDEMCSRCGSEISDYSPDYFAGSICVPYCNDCSDRTEDCPFNSFPQSSMPASLLAHWIPPNIVSPKTSLIYLPSFISHYARIAKPGDAFLSCEELLVEMKRYYKEQEKNCKIS